MKKVILALVLVVAGGAIFWSYQKEQQKVDDMSYMWMEEVMGEAALKWVRERNTETLEELSRSPQFAELRDQSLEILNAKDKLVYGSIRGDYVYNLWQDAVHIKGLWRRSTWESYENHKDKWEVLLDIDQLAKKEGKSWVYKSVNCLKPDNNLCLLKLSDGGKDASYVREFDIKTKSFVKGGFELEESKSSVSWLDKDTVLLGSTFGKDAVTESGYPRIVKMWKRGSAEKDAKVIFEGDKTDVSVGAFVDEINGRDEVLIYRSKTFFTSQYFHKQGDNIKPLLIPEDASYSGAIGAFVMVSLRSDKLGFKRGDLVALNFEALKNDKIEAQLVFSPNEKQALSGIASSKKHLFISYLDDVQSKVMKMTPPAAGGDNKWTSQLIVLPGNGKVSLGAMDEDKPRMTITYQDFLTPPSLMSLNPDTLSTKLIQKIPSRFDGSDLVSRQFMAESKDGTAIPYFIVHKKDIKLNGKNPTLLYGYGGFEVALEPFYSSITGKLWLENGGVYVLANIRGGGEYGPAWHQAALKHNRHKAFEDFIGVGEDLVARKITSPKHLGISGGSNGGLLVGSVFTQRPDLFNAVLCSVPLLDMMRFHKLLAGASWVGEYGDPDNTEDAAYIRTYSPFHNVEPDADYPEVFFITSTKDDRVHPGHARKMAKKMDDQGHKVYYYENIEGGHSASANLIQRAEQYAMQYIYLNMKLRDSSEQTN